MKNLEQLKADVTRQYREGFALWRFLCSAIDGQKDPVDE